MRARVSVISLLALAGAAAALPRPAEAQTPVPAPDVVVLRGGGQLSGVVMEHEPHRGTRILLPDGTVRALTPADVAAVQYAGGTTSVGSPVSPPAAPAYGAPQGGPSPPLVAPGPAPTSPRGTGSPAPASSGGFSIGRVIVEWLLGSLGGSGAGMLAWYAVCGFDDPFDDDCVLLGALSGLVANIVATPGVVTLIGRLMGARGTYWDAFYGGMLAFTAASISVADVNIGLTVSMMLMPVTAALGFEIFGAGNAPDPGDTAGVRLAPTLAVGRADDGSAVLTFGLGGAM